MGDYVVIKVGGEVVAAQETLGPIARDVAALRRSGIAVVMVHGGGPQATELQKRLGQEPRIVAGRRITDDATLEVMKMVVAGKVNTELCAALVAAGASPVGLHGPSGLVIRAKKRPPRVVEGAGPDHIDFGHVGDVVGVNAALITLLTNAEHVPVIACLGASEDGALYNINADIVASKLAAALEARALVLVSDVPGVLRDVADPRSRIARLTKSEGARAIKDKTATKGMIPKLTEAFAAIDAGVRAVHIVGKLGPGDLEREINEPGSVGTVLVA